MPSADKKTEKSRARSSQSSKRVSLDSELIVITKPTAGVVAAEGVAMAQPSLGDLASVLSAADAKITPIFDVQDSMAAAAPRMEMPPTGEAIADETLLLATTGSR